MRPQTRETANLRIRENPKPGVPVFSVFRVFVFSCVRGHPNGFWLSACLLLFAGAPAAAQTAAGKPVTYKNLEMSVASVERAPTASLKDCPPGGNTVNATTRPGEEFAVVTVKFKVLSGFQPTPMKRPVLTDANGKTYNTAVSFVDVGSVPEFSCAIPFRVPTGTTVKSLQIDTASLDLTSAEPKK
jgi:hypothetical protein